VTPEDDVSNSNGSNVGENEARLARARRAFEQELREASEKGTRAARRLIVPVLWGGALLGGALLAMTILRLARRQPPPGFALLRVNIQPSVKPVGSSVRSLLPALGGALARLAVQHYLQPAPELAASAPVPAPLTATGNGRASS
jgi:hypothetical protein